MFRFPLKKWIRLFNQSGVDGLIVNKRPGRTAIIQGSQAIEFSSIMEHPEFADRTFWTAKAFHGYISNTYQVECSHETIVRFLHREGFALKIPQPWPDRQDQEKRAVFLKELEALYNNPALIFGFKMNPVLRVIQDPGAVGIKKETKPE